MILFITKNPDFRFSHNTIHLTSAWKGFLPISTLIFDMRFLSPITLIPFPPALFPLCFNIFSPAQYRPRLNYRKPCFERYGRIPISRTLGPVSHARYRPLASTHGVWGFPGILYEFLSWNTSPRLVHLPFVYTFPLFVSQPRDQPHFRPPPLSSFVDHPFSSFLLFSCLSRGPTTLYTLTSGKESVRSGWMPLGLAGRQSYPLHWSWLDGGLGGR